MLKILNLIYINGRLASNEDLKSLLKDECRYGERALRSVRYTHTNVRVIKYSTRWWTKVFKRLSLIKRLPLSFVSMILTERELSSDEKGDIILLPHLKEARTLADIIVTDKANRKEFYDEFEIDNLCREYSICLGCNFHYVPTRSLAHALNECRQVKSAEFKEFDIDSGETYYGETVEGVVIKYYD